MDAFVTFFTQQWRRHLRSPAIWIVIIATMIGARYIIPLPEAGYVTLSVNNAYPLPSSSVIGLQLGIVIALLMSPLAYIYLKAGPTRVQPWQIEDVAPSRRLMRNLGQGAADIAALWMMLIFIALAGIILSVFRLPLSDIRPLQTLLVMFVIAAPAMSLIAAVRMFLSNRPILRGAWGDALFFVLWIAGITVAAFMLDSPKGSAFHDIFGYAASIKGSTDVAVTSAAVGGAPATDSAISLEPLKAVLSSEFLASRLFWMMMAVGLIALSALLYKPRRMKRTRKGDGLFSKLAKLINPLGDMASKPVIGALGAFHPLVKSGLNQLLQPRWTGLALVMISLSGFVLPFRKAVGPALMLILIFLLSRQSGLWEKRHNRNFRMTLPHNLTSQFFANWFAASLLIGVLLIPSIIGKLMSGTLGGLLPEMVALAVVMPAILLGLGYLTRTGVMGRMIMLAVWYGYLNV